MGRVQAIQVGEIPVQTGESIGSTPPTFQVRGLQPIGSAWTTGLFDCHENQTNAILTAVLPCMTFGQIAEVIDEGHTACPMGSFMYLFIMPFFCAQWILGSNYRAKLRMKFNLVEAPYTDVFSHIFCLWCSLCQEFRELQNRNLDPALGWYGILAQRQGNVQVNAPPPNQFMSR